LKQMECVITTVIEKLSVSPKELFLFLHS
jgi:hypothetical protein